MIQNIFFDLDGTLTDPSEGLTNSIAYALEKHGIQIENKDTLKRFIGPPLFDTFENGFGFSHEEAKQCIHDFREYFQPKGIFENRVFQGIPELLQSLNDAGKRLMVATSKPEPFARQILEHFNLTTYFYYIAGGTLDESLIEKPDILKYALKTTGISKTDTCVMIGDRKHDVFGGKTLSMKTIGVLYGFGDRQELEAAGADMIAENVTDLYRIIMEQ